MLVKHLSWSPGLLGLGPLGPLGSSPAAGLVLSLPVCGGSGAKWTAAFPQPSAAAASFQLPVLTGCWDLAV